jgi:hypothetical protein
MNERANKDERGDQFLPRIARVAASIIFTTVARRQFGPSAGEAFFSW